MGLLGVPRMQVFSLLCPRCGEPMRIIAFVKDVGSIQRILASLGEPTQPPGSPPPPAVRPMGRRTSIRAKKPLPEYALDQRVSTECMLKYMRIPSTAGTRDPERSRFFHNLLSASPRRRTPFQIAKSPPSPSDPAGSIASPH